MERSRCRLALFKGEFPAGIEIDGIGENHPRQPADYVRWNQVLDLPLRAFRNPVVDRDPGFLRTSAKVHRPHSRSVALREQVQVLVQKRVVFLSPDRVGEVQRETCPFSAVRALAPSGKLTVQGVEGGVQFLLGKQEMKRFRHLAFRLPPRAAVGHGQRQGDAVGRIEQISPLRGQTPVQAEGKGVVALRQRLQFRVGGRGRGPLLRRTQLSVLRRAAGGGGRQERQQPHDQSELADSRAHVPFAAESHGGSSSLSMLSANDDLPPI